ncbi:MAG: VWA domain-containing protein [Myxococcaceae bacterium]|nr:VWA domain-containing protein [Myxococcaceae bacterium]
METRIVEFAEVLRQNGLKVAVTETRDAVEAVGHAGLDDPELFRATLEATLCKRAADVETFNRAFTLFFTGAVKLLEQLDQSLADRIREEGLLEGDELKMIVWMLERLAGQLSPLTQAVLQGNRAQLANLFRQATLQLDFARVQNALQTGFYSRRLLTGAGFEQLRTDVEAINDELTARGVSARGVEIVGRQLSNALRQVEEAARAEAARQITARLKKAQGSVSDKALHLLTRQEIEIAQRAVRALAEKLKARLVRRQRSRKRGQLNPRRTLRKNLSAGGVPMVPQFRSRRPARPDVVVLCDVSDSVRVTSRMMVLFTFTLQSLFARVRSFIFVSELGEVTKFFKDAKPEEAIDAATQSGVISLASNSNYGHALAEFNRGYLGSVTRRTTVLIIGDGRNNHNPPNVWALEDVKRKAKRVVWICTEPRQNWGFGDSEMLRYEKAVSQVVTVQSLSDLERIAQQLVPV